MGAWICVFRRLGCQAVLSELFEAPDPVFRFLNNRCHLENIPVFDSLDGAAFERLKKMVVHQDGRVMVPVVFAGNSVVRSKNLPFLDQKICIFWIKKFAFSGSENLPFLDQKICLFWSENLPFLDQKIYLFRSENWPFLVRKLTFSGQKICLFWIKKFAFSGQKIYLFWSSNFSPGKKWQKRLAIWPRISREKHQLISRLICQSQCSMHDG